MARVKTSVAAKSKVAAAEKPVNYAYVRLSIGEANETFRYPNILISFHDPSGKRIGTTTLLKNVPIVDIQSAVDEAWERVLEKL